jgi:cellulose synthase/poly-beta-1,6-N-acetylglucosamine synthase-like glycosyltransferase
MPAYNAAAFVARAVDSVLAQTWTGYELLVVDDGSRDETLEVLARLRPGTKVSPRAAASTWHFLTQTTGGSLENWPRKWRCSMLTRKWVIARRQPALSTALAALSATGPARQALSQCPTPCS